MHEDRSRQDGGLIRALLPSLRGALALGGQCGRREARGLLRLLAGAALRRMVGAGVGFQKRALLYQAGFYRITMGATYNHVGTPELKRAMSEATARFCEQVDFIDQALALGWVDQDIRPRLSDALRAEGSHIEGFFAAAFCDVVAW